MQQLPGRKTRYRNAVELTSLTSTASFIMSLRDRKVIFFTGTSYWRTLDEKAYENTGKRTGLQHNIFVIMMTLQVLLEWGETNNSQMGQDRGCMQGAVASQVPAALRRPEFGDWWAGEHFRVARLSPYHANTFESEFEGSEW
ncbi:hypothetical protein ElyMa_006093300 [Elysia marginata]|uniref:Sulfatase N-terminal domain-containing protein n=1 Tax=Elysia marginata TaxID=1093978 RepID=A0AAV4GRZ5_9GAST|nr:hypothetical protein ElyMa_006093300 [Elysia marginata]